MAGLPRIQTRGQVTLPADVREAAGLHPGDAVVFRVVGPGRVEVSTLPRVSLSEMIFRVQSPDVFDWEHVRHLGEQAAAEEFITEMERKKT